MSWYDPTSWFQTTNNGTTSRAPGTNFNAGAGTAFTNADIERAKAARVAQGKDPLPRTYANGARVHGNADVAGATTANGKPTYAAQTISDQTGEAIPWQTDDETRKALLSQQGAIAGQSANRAEEGYNAYTRRARGALDQSQNAIAGLQALANGQNSVSAEQLRQGNQQSLAQQSSLAAGAAPQNAAAAARTAAIQSGRISGGLAGQQAVAGLQERNQAQTQYTQAAGNYGNLIQGLRGQDLSSMTANRQTAANAYGAGAAGAPTPTWWDKHGKEVEAGGGALLSAFSDRRLKTGVKDGSDAADKSLKGLSAHLFKYKDEAKFGKGERVGIMAQDLEKAGLGHAVIETKAGKAIHGGHLAAALAAMLPGIDKRLSALEDDEAGEDEPAAPKTASGGLVAALLTASKKKKAK